MKKFYLFFSIVFIGVVIMSGCKKTANFQTESLTDYLQLQSGKYITYRMDSTLFVNFGTQDTVISYLAKDMVDTTITDNLNRPSWRVIRYINDTAASGDWLSNETYMVTPTKQDVEVVENNMRYIKLVAPITDGYSWPGNSYIDATSDTFNVVTYLQGWNYTYDSVGMPFTTLWGTVPNSVTVQQRNEVIGDPTNPSIYSEINYSEEVYGKGIGLIYKNFFHAEFQPPNGGTSVGSWSGYGIRLNMVDHN
ncbi:MAG: hypothetical protein JST87_14730 [Bacteroidetes bacterium]|nr:hypothetical protein [Bacteroidota bacterium]